MMIEEKTYVGELIRKSIKDQKLTNGYVISRLIKDNFEMSESKFSNKLYGQRDKFTEEEVIKISEYLGISL